MPFTIDGRVHFSGIANEHEVCSFLNSRSTIIKPAIVPPDAIVEHRGGTGSKADAEIVAPSGNKTISLKHHKTGTFDWLNSSAAVPAAMKLVLNTGFQAVRSTYDSTGKADTDLKNARTACEALLGEHLRAMTSDTIKATLSNCYTIYTDYVIITDVSKNTLVAFDRHKNIPELRTYEGWTYFLKSTPRAKTSAQIWRRSLEGVEVNTKLRLRLVLNNGVSALLGISTANKGSSPCLKIQQDDVSHFVASLVDPVKEAYTASAPTATATGTVADPVLTLV